MKLRVATCLAVAIALACGLAVITYDTGGSGECVSSSCGNVVEKGDYNALKQAILNADFSREDCTERAKEYSFENMAESYKNLFERVKN